jgi:uncharacterized membrane protein YhaH (DUF805 family)
LIIPAARRKDAVAARYRSNKGMQMGEMSLVHWIIGLIILLVYLLPIIKILHKAGYSGWWVILVFIPLINIIFLWVFAYADWPSLRAAQGRPT